MSVYSLIYGWSVERIDELPFVADVPVEGGKEGATKKCFWKVKPSGNYRGDRALGKEYALDFLHYVSVVKRGKYLLFEILKEMAEQGKFSEGKKGKDVGWGIEVGFLDEVSGFAVAGALHRLSDIEDSMKAKAHLMLASFELERVEEYVKKATATA